MLLLPSLLLPFVVSSLAVLFLLYVDIADVLTVLSCIEHSSLRCNTNNDNNRHSRRDSDVKNNPPTQQILFSATDPIAATTNIDSLPQRLAPVNRH